MPIHVNMPHFSSRKTKIIATLGPASAVYCSTDAVQYATLLHPTIAPYRINLQPRHP